MTANQAHELAADIKELAPLAVNRLKEIMADLEDAKFGEMEKICFIRGPGNGRGQWWLSVVKIGNDQYATETDNDMDVAYVTMTSEEVIKCGQRLLDAAIMEAEGLEAVQDD
jgi:hypothetical protein